MADPITEAQEKIIRELAPEPPKPAPPTPPAVKPPPSAIDTRFDARSIVAGMAVAMFILAILILLGLRDARDILIWALVGGAVAFIAVFTRVKSWYT